MPSEIKLEHIDKLLLINELKDEVVVCNRQICRTASNAIRQKSRKKLLSG